MLEDALHDEPMVIDQRVRDHSLPNSSLSVDDDDDRSLEKSSSGKSRKD